MFNKKEKKLLSIFKSYFNNMNKNIFTKENEKVEDSLKNKIKEKIPPSWPDRFKKF